MSYITAGICVCMLVIMGVVSYWAWQIHWSCGVFALAALIVIALFQLEGEW